MWPCTVSLFSVICVFNYTAASNILMLTSIPSYSHFQLTFRLARELLGRGHEITMISRFPQKTPIKNYVDIPVMELMPLQDLKNQETDFIERRLQDNVFQKYDAIYEHGTRSTEAILRNKNVRKLLESPDAPHFDLVIVEYFQNHALFGFGYHFKAPVIVLSPTGPGIMNNFLTASMDFSSHIPNMVSQFDSGMDFSQRLTNFFMDSIANIKREIYSLPKHRWMFRHYFPGTANVDFDAILYNVSLVLMNGHESVSDVAALFPNVINIGGFHLNQPQKLPRDIQEFLDNAPDGVVLFAMGSTLSSRELGPEKLQILRNVFAKLKQKVLWKFEEDFNADLPGNVKIVKWMPQQDVLAHPNIKAFIFHAGYLTIIECVYFGVPFIGIPIFGDHTSNVARAVKNGYGFKLDFATLSEETLSHALDEILNNPRYREKARKYSVILKEQPVNPLDKAVFYVEYVIRHRGAPHMRNAGMDLNSFQRNSLDVVLFVAVLVGFLFVLISKFIKVCCCRKGGVLSSTTKKYN